MRNFYIIIVAVALIGGGVLLYAMRGGSAAVEPVELGELEQQDLIGMAQPAGVYGDPDAPITIMEFVDYQCPKCKEFGLFVKPQVDVAYIRTGQARLVVHDFPLLALHPHAFVAARAARCAGDQDRYFEYHDLVFETQDDWSPMGNAIGHFNGLADELELDAQAFRDCLESDRHAKVVTANMKLGLALGVGGTPTLLVHRGGPPVVRLGGSGFLDVQQAIEGDGEN